MRLHWTHLNRSNEALAHSEESEFDSTKGRKRYR